MMRHPCRIATIQLAVALSLAGCNRQGASSEGKNTANESLSPVKAVPARRVVLGGWTELLGATQALPGHTARVSAAVEGHVLTVLGDGQGPAIVEGQRVERGQVIVRLDDRIIRANRDKVVAGLDELAQQKKEAESAVKLAQLDVQRLENLSPAGTSGQGLPLVSRLEREKARLALEDAEAKQLALLAKERGVRTDLQVLDLQLEYYQLRAPIAGQLGTVQAVPGQTLPVGSAVADVVDLAEIDVFCLAPPAAAARLVSGQPAALKQGTAGGESAGPVGKVAYVAVQAQPETGSFPVKVRFPNRDLRLRANAVVRLEVLTEPQKERLCLPIAALLEDQDPPGIVVVEEVTVKKDDRDHELKVGKAKKLRALIGVRDRDRGLVEIIDLEDPEKKAKVAPGALLFVVEGGHGLHDGDAVKLEEEEEKEKAE
jgi:macrolide-specific efflux system membrane fusion protein